MKIKLILLISILFCVNSFAKNNYYDKKINHNYSIKKKIVLLNKEKEPEYPGFSKTKRGLYYKFHKQDKNSRKAFVEDILIGEFTVKYKDSILASNVGNPARFTRVDTIMFDGDINEGLTMVGIGDSATFIVSADSLKAHSMHLPEFVEEGAMLLYDFKVTDIFSKEDFEKEKQAAAALNEKTYKDAIEKEKNDIQKYLLDNKIEVKPTSSGLYYIPLKEGTGTQAKNGQKVSINYVGKLLDGKLFDTNIEAEATKGGIKKEDQHFKVFEFELGKGEVIAGLEEGMYLMKVGGKAVLLLPSKIAYGESGAGGFFGAYTPLLFEVELLDAK